MSGAIAAVLVGCITCLASCSFAATLVVFFISSSLLTKLNPAKKRKIEEDFKEGGQRDCVQVLANGGGGTLIALWYLFLAGGLEGCIEFGHHHLLSALQVAFIGHYACCNGDTWASELGVLSKRDPILVTTGKRVPKGTNGGMSLEGTTASVAGGALIGLTFYVSNILLGACSGAKGQWQLIILGAMTGFLGSLLDSLLGATLQYSAYCAHHQKVVGKPSSTTRHITGLDVLSNHQVNFVSALLTALLSPYIARFLFVFT